MRSCWTTTGPDPVTGVLTGGPAEPEMLRGETQAGHPGWPRAPRLEQAEEGLCSEARCTPLSPRLGGQYSPLGAVTSLAGAESLPVTRSLTKERRLKDAEDCAWRAEGCRGLSVGVKTTSSPAGSALDAETASACTAF